MGSSEQIALLVSIVTDNKRTDNQHLLYEHPLSSDNKDGGQSRY